MKRNIESYNTPAADQFLQDAFLLHFRLKILILLFKISMLPAQMVLWESPPDYREQNPYYDAVCAVEMSCMFKHTEFQSLITSDILWFRPFKTVEVWLICFRILWLFDPALRVLSAGVSSSNTLNPHSDLPAPHNTGAAASIAQEDWTGVRVDGTEIY